MYLNKGVWNLARARCASGITNVLQFIANAFAINTHNVESLFSGEPSCVHQ